MKQLDNEFTRYDLSLDEIQKASVLSEETRAVMQNLLSESATQRLDLVFDPNNPMIFTQEEAYIKGKIDTLRYLLSLTDSV